MISAKEFHDRYLGQAIDVDGVAGVQCVDLFKEVCYLAGKSPYSLGGSGYAYEIINRFDALELGTYFDKVSLSNIQYGDWIVWSMRRPETPDSHTAMFLNWDGNRVYVLGQNQLGIRAANEGSLTTDGILGVLRLKQWIQTPPTSTGTVLNAIPADFVYENATFTTGVESIKIRQAPDLQGKDTQLRYKNGMSVHYDGYVKRDGYVWISWISANDQTRRWMAVRELASNRAYGSFR